MMEEPNKLETALGVWMNEHGVDVDKFSDEELESVMAGTLVMSAVRMGRDTHAALFVPEMTTRMFAGFLSHLPNG